MFISVLKKNCYTKESRTEIKLLATGITISIDFQDISIETVLTVR